MNKETTFELRIPISIDQLDGYLTPAVILNHFSWQVETKKVTLSNGLMYMGIFVRSNIQQPCPSDWSCIASASVRLESPRENMRSLEKPIYFMAFNWEHNKRGNDRFATWNDIKRFANEEKITIHIKIEAIGLSNANNSVSLIRLSEDVDDKLKMCVTFKDIHTTFAMMSPEMCHENGSTFRICIFKRPYVNEQEPNGTQEALWLYLICSRIGKNEQRKWSYQIRLLTDNDNGPLCTEESNVRFSKFFDSNGAPFISLKNLYDQRNKYLSSDGAIKMEIDLAVMEETTRSGDVRIKTEPISPKCSESRPLVLIERPVNERANWLPLAAVKTEIELANEYSVDVTDARLLEQRESVIVQPNVHRKRPAPSTATELNCILCSINLLETDPYSTICGHLFCAQCLNEDIGKRQICVKCDSPVVKSQCIQICLTDEQLKKKRKKTRSSLAFRDFYDQIERDILNRLSDQETHATNHVLLNCPLCDEHFVEPNVYTINCGHLYCKGCLYKDIAKRYQCVVCNKKVNQWIQIFFT